MAVINQEITDRYAIYNGDCVEVMQNLPDDSVDMSIYSPPFGGLYSYSSSERDLSNCTSYDDFFAHYDFVVQELHRITKPGRMTAVHCMPVPKTGANAGRVLRRPRTKIAASHGSFDNNIDVLTGTLERIRGSDLVAPMEWLDY